MLQVAYEEFIERIVKPALAFIFIIAVLLTPVLLVGAVENLFVGLGKGIESSSCLPSMNGAEYNVPSGYRGASK